jgi:hypothetical protein
MMFSCHSLYLNALVTDHYGLQLLGSQVEEETYQQTQATNTAARCPQDHYVELDRVKYSAYTPGETTICVLLACRSLFRGEFESKYLIVVGAGRGEVRVDATDAFLRALFG